MQILEDDVRGGIQTCRPTEQFTWLSGVPVSVTLRFTLKICAAGAVCPAPAVRNHDEEHGLASYCHQLLSGGRVLVIPAFTAVAE